jgi:hypothetical protein
MLLCFQMRIKFFVVFAIILLFFVSARLTNIKADTYTPTVTDVFFTLAGKPYYGEVKYTMDCYGYEYSPGGTEEPDYNEDGSLNAPPNIKYEPTKVYSYKATCPIYGCEIYESYYEYYKYTHFDYCDISGEANGKEFSVKNVAKKPFTSCNTEKYFPYIEGEKFVKQTPEYESCIENIDYNTSDCDEYLVKCIGTNASTDICIQGKGTHTIDGVEVVPDAQGQYKACVKKASDLFNLEKSTCDVYLQEVPLEEISFTDDCEVVTNHCTLKANLPSNILPVTNENGVKKSNNEECMQKQILDYKKYLEQKTQFDQNNSNSNTNISDQKNSNQSDKDLTEPNPSSNSSYTFFLVIIITLGIGIVLITFMIKRKRNKKENIPNDGPTSLNAFSENKLEDNSNHKDDI